MSLFTPPSGETWRDPYPMYAELREAGPIHHAPDLDLYVLPRYAEVFEAVTDTKRFSSAHGLTWHYGDMEALGQTEAPPMVMLDPPAHTEFRRLVARGFTPRAVTSLEPTVRAFVRERLDLAVADGGTVDIIALLFKPLASLVVGQYLGVPAEDQGRFDAWSDAIMSEAPPGAPLSAADAAADLGAYFADLVDRRRSEPGDDTISHLVNTDGDAPPASLVQVIGYAFTMVAGGNDTVVGLLGGTADALTEHRDQRQILLDTPVLIPDAVEELLRWISPVQGLARTTTEPVEIGGITIPAGKRVALLYASANRDERQFGPDAGDLDLRRAPRQILTFAHGAHHCLGAAAARLQGRVVLEELLARCPEFEVDAAAGEFAEGEHTRRYRTLPFTASP